DIGTKDYHFLKRNDVKIRAIFGEKEARSMWKETAEEQLNHYNPYTKMKRKDDPVFQVFEYYNELNICYNKFNELEPKTKELVLKRWRAWLEKKYGTIDKLNDVWNKSHWGRGANYKSFAEVPEKYSGFDWEHFMQDVNDEFMEYCRQIVRGTGYKGLVVQRNLGRTYRDLWTRQKISDVIITNSYYQHPVGIYTPGADHTCGQTSSIASELGYWRTIATTKNFDRPLTTTEYNHCYWNKYRYEMMSVFPSYSAFQNFSTLVIHSDAIDWREKRKRLSAFNVSESPAIRCSELFNQCFFMRGDVKVSNNRVDMLVSEKLAKSDEGAYGMSGGQMRLPLITGFAVKCDSPISESLKHVKAKKASLEVAPNGSAEIVTMGWFQTVVDNNSGNFNIDKFVGVMKEKGLLPKNNLSSPKDGIYHTDTGQIYIDSKKKFAKTVTDFSCVATVDKSEEVDMGALKLLRTSVPASVGVASLDGKKISKSSRLIFVYATQEDNEDSIRSYDNSLSIKGGMGPIVMKRGKVSAELKLDASKKYAVYPIALNGERREKLDMEFENGVMQINIDNGKLKNGAVAMFEIVAE
ncbi:MAG: beta-galactosidase, partial [Opitutales bacterium]|nr:beta-galactosidase [Opitutales bacterium]